MKFNSNKGFTLIELLVVVSIVGLLSSIVMASVVDARVKARDATRGEQLHQMDLAIGLYKSDHEGKVPLLGEIRGGDGTGCSSTNQANRLACVAKSSGGAAWEAFKTEMAAYIKTLPNSLNGIDYIYLPPASMGSGASDESYQISSDSEYDPNIDLGYSSDGYIIDIPTEPIISNIIVAYRGSSSARITWITDVPTDSIIDYGNTIEYGATVDGGGGFVNSHSVTIYSLVAGTNYHFRINSTNEYGDNSLSDDGNFTTLGVGPLPGINNPGQTPGPFGSPSDGERTDDGVTPPGGDRTYSGG